MFKKLIVYITYIIEIALIVLLVKDYVFVPNQIQQKFFNVKPYTKKKVINNSDRMVTSRKRSFSFSKYDGNPFINSTSRLKRKKYLRDLRQKSLPKLQGIIPKRKNPAAILNDQIVYAGDEIDNYIVIDIYHKTVLLQDKKNSRNIISLKMEEDK